MYEQPRWQVLSWVPIGAGLLWLGLAWSSGIVATVLALPPGALLLASGLSALLWPGDRRILQYMAFAGTAGAVVALLLVPLVGIAALLLLLPLALASVVVSGMVSLRQEPHTEGVTVAKPSLRLAVDLAVDNALLGSIHCTVHQTEGRDGGTVRRDVEAGLRMWEERGWLDDPASYHVAPPPLEDYQLSSARSRGWAYEHLSFTSGYEPHTGEPGRDRYVAFRPNRTAHAWVIRDRSAPRPWLVCIHGYMMGHPFIDFGAFRPGWLHERLGMNLLVPVLPFHGPRKVGLRSGDRFFTGMPYDTIHAEAQAMWDIRRLLSWIRAQDAPAVGVYGLSLGGFNTALLASLDGDLACAIAGIPATDLARLSWTHGPPLSLAYLERYGLTREALPKLLAPVSPLALEPRVPRSRRYVFGATADLLVAPDQVRDLWHHWGRPPILWFDGGHMTFMWSRAVHQFIDDALRDSGLAAPADEALAPAEA